MPLTVTRRNLIFLLLSAAMVTVFVISAGWGFPLDDSWIHQTYGRNLALHGKWAFILGEPSAASTSPLYTLILAIGYFLRIPYLFWAHFVGTFALALTAIFGARLADYAMPDHKTVGWWVGLILIFSWHLIWAAASGMETMLFSMLTLALIYVAWRETDNKVATHDVRSLIVRGSVLGILTALTTLARPEGMMLGGIIAILMLLVRPQGNLRKVIIYGVGAAIGFLVVLSPYLWLNLQLTGGVLPNTANAKFEQHAILLQLPYTTRFFDLLWAIFAGGQFLLIPGMFAYAWAKLRDENLLMGLYFLLPIIYALAHIALYAARLPASYQHGRYVIPALPSLIVVGVIGTFWLIQNQAKLKNGIVKTASRVTVRALAVSVVAVTLAFLPIGIGAYSNDVALINAEMVASAEYIRDNIPQDDLMAIHDIGAVGYFAPRQMIDIAGLVTPEIIPIVDEPDALWQYMEDAGAIYLMAFPDQIPGRNPDDPRLCLIFTTDAEITARLRGETGGSMAIYRLAYDATCDD